MIFFSNQHIHAAYSIWKFWMNFQMKLVSQDSINNIFIDYDPETQPFLTKSSMDEVMGWCKVDIKPLPEAMMTCT